MAKIFTPKHNKSRQHRSSSRQLPQFVANVEKYDPKGKAILSSPDQRITFVSGALVGEKVKVKPIKYTDKFIEAELIDVLESSEKRVTPKCQHFEQCGGCQLQFMSPSEQIDVKQNAIDEMLCNKLNLQHIPWQDPIHHNSWHYRRAARLAVWHEKNGHITMGYRKKNDKEIIHIDSCAILSEDANNLLPSLQLMLSELNSRRIITHVQIMVSNEGNNFIIRCMKPLPDNEQSLLKQWAKQHQCNLFLELNEKTFITVWRQDEASSTELSYSLNDQTLYFRPNNFIQVNPEVNQSMVQRALEWLEVNNEDVVLDLFSGIGNFTLPMAKSAKHVIAVEGVLDMVKQLQRNASQNNLDNISAHQADLTKLDEKNKPQWLKPIDKLLLDPARDGAFEVVKKIPLLNPKAILYVSCEPITMQRDLKHLLAVGYQLTHFCLLNMFPHTQHTEAMALLTQKK